MVSDGAAYALGRINGRGCWYLYTLHNVCPGVDEPDQTLEILMQDLDPKIMKRFFKEGNSDVKKVTETSGIKDFLPGALIDDALFDPCGYSMNGLINVTAYENSVIPHRKFPIKRLLRNTYFTIHITPQEQCSYVSFETNLKMVSKEYVSFETNLKMTCYKELINKVLDAFKPGRFLMTLFANEGAPCGASIKTFENNFTGYQRNDLQLCQMKHYNLTYGHFGKIADSNGMI
ncbi:hypothetical protein QZH41_008373 [Actinostola sp. cb2023]|nr:hypothetical protein QZH41_019255 [Actinostola sp. cb2023]KAK3747915.1 hypothetical protein QZH41_008373 [Actinostola sp. cb2023]